MIKIKEIWENLTEKEQKKLGFNHLQYLLKEFHQGDYNICLKKAMYCWHANLLELENIYIKIDDLLKKEA